MSEYNENTINPTKHSEIFARLEKFANSWHNIDLAVSCRKYRSIILDESGGEKDQALKIIDEGLKIYGETNSKLVRAKAKVLHRANDHHGSLELSRKLIDGDAQPSETEKVFLDRDAAISAERQGDFETVRRYFIYGSKAAKNCEITSMTPIRVGLMADAALASWHAGDSKTCLCDFVIVLQELNTIDPKSSLRAKYCHAMCRHVLLWLNQDVTDEKLLLTTFEETKIYPGILSNPEPSSEIEELFITPIEMAWYMLAAVENNCCLDVGITQKLTTFLPKGPVYEGQILLTASKLRKSFILPDRKLFVVALRETVTEFSYSKELGENRNNFDPKNITYGSLPIPTLEQLDGISDISEQLVLCFKLYFFRKYYGARSSNREP